MHGATNGESMKFKKLLRTRQRLADDVYDQLLSAIVHGHISPGERLIQEHIATAIDVSRTPVREALLRLEQEGILEQIGRKGFAIREISGREVRAIYGAREAIEGYAAFMVAGHRSPEKLAAIKLCIDTGQSVSRPSLEEDFTLNRNIHCAIVEQTGNPFLLDMFDKIWNRGLSLFLFAATRGGVKPPDLISHLRLYEVVAAGTPEEAHAAMIAHIREGLELHLPASNSL